MLTDFWIFRADSCALCEQKISSATITLPCKHVFHRRCIHKFFLRRHSLDNRFYCPVDTCKLSLDKNSEAIKASLSTRSFYLIEPYIYMSLSAVLMIGATGVMGKEVCNISRFSAYAATGCSILGIDTTTKLVLYSSIGVIGLQSFNLGAAYLNVFVALKKATIFSGNILYHLF